MVSNLVGGDWNMTGLFFHMTWEFHHLNGLSIFFRGVGLNHQPDMYIYI